MSTNGTRLNGEKLDVYKEYPLAHGDRIRHRRPDGDHLRVSDSERTSRRRQCRQSLCGAANVRRDGLSGDPWARRCEVLETTGRLLPGETGDRYEGWIAEDRLVPAWDRTDFLQTGIATLFADVYSAPDAQSEIVTKLVVSDAGLHRASGRGRGVRAGRSWPIIRSAMSMMSA